MRKVEIPRELIEHDFQNEFDSLHKPFDSHGLYILASEAVQTFAPEKYEELFEEFCKNHLIQIERESEDSILNTKYYILED